MKKFKNFIKNRIPFAKFIYTQIIVLEQYLKFLIVKHRQKRIYKKLCLVTKENKRKIKIAFLVNENEKWCCQSLYDKLKLSKHFEPIIFLTSLDDFKRKDIEEKNNKNIEFFNKYCNNVQLVYDNKMKQFDDLKKYSPDIVVYQQPSCIARNQNIFSISRFALAIYIPYCFVEEYKLLIEHYFFDFHSLLFRKYISHNLIEQEYKNKGYKINNLRVVGYPKLEQYLDNKNMKRNI